MKFSIVGLLLVLSITLLIYFVRMKARFFERPEISVIDEIVNLVPKSRAEIEVKSENVIKESQKGLALIHKLPAMQRTFNNTLRALDVLIERLNIVMSSIELLTLVSPDEDLRNAAREAVIKLSSFKVDHFSMNPQLYQAVSEYEKLVDDPSFKCGDNLTQQERYFLDELLKDFRRNGLQLSAEKQIEIKNLQKKIAERTVQFDMNYNAAQRKLLVSKDELRGLDDAFIDSLEKNDKGEYILKADTSTYMKVMSECAVVSTRKGLCKEYNLRAYPENEKELTEIIRLRGELAKALGYKSFAHYDIDSQMVKTPEIAQDFIKNIAKRAGVKTEQEIALLKKNLPSGVELKDGKFYPWDLMYVIDQYKRKHLAIDEAAIAEYFPLDHTLPALLSIYENFFGLTFKKIPKVQLWHDEVIFYAVYKGGNYIGSVMLDLFPRPFKYSHACQITLVPAVRYNGKLYPSVLAVIANFPSATNDRPSLLTRNDVRTFFHEFGHAIHALLGQAALASQSGTATKVDFVEMPSQMLEEWLFDPQILKMVSSHYKTKEPLPDELIEKMQAVKNFDTGNFALRQMFLASVALNYYLPGGTNVHKLWKELAESMQPHMIFDQGNHGYAAFGHLTGYGSKYYGYMWSKVFALDLFSNIKPHGLLNQIIGDRYVKEVIGKGGSDDPMNLLTNFLGRKPTSDAFFKDMGL